MFFGVEAHVTFFGKRGSQMKFFSFRTGGTRTLITSAGITVAGLLLLPISGSVAPFGAPLGQAIGANGNVMKLPCSSDGSNVFLQKCGDVVDLVTKDLETKVKTHVDLLYRRGEKVSTQEGGTADSVGGKGYYFGKPVCDLLPHQYNDYKPEGDTSGGAVNHIGETCGNFINVRVSIQGRSARTGLIMGGAAQFGSREAGYIRGGWTQMIAFHLNKVVGEMKSQNQVTYSASCQDLATEITELGGKTKDLSNRLIANVGPDQVAEVKKCQVEDFEHAANSANPDLGPLRQSAQQLCTARAALESATVQLASCEVMARAGEDYRRVFGNTEAFFSNEIQKGVSAACNSQCGGQCSGACRVTFRRGRPRFNRGACESCLNSCGNSCYPVQIRQTFKNMLQPWKVDKS